MKSSIWKIALGLAITVLLTLPWLVFRDKVTEFVEVSYGGLFIVCLLANMVVIIPVSSTASVIIASSMLNPLLCVLIGSLGAVLGEHTSYACGRLGWRVNDIEAKLSENHTLGWLYRHKHAILIAAALFPSTISDVVGLVAGSCKVPWRTFALSVWIGKLAKYGLTILMLYYVLPWLTLFLDAPFRAWVENFLDLIVYGQ